MSNLANTNSTTSRSPEPRGEGRPILSAIVARYQITVPVEVRELYGLEIGDVFEWTFNPELGALILIPKKPQLLPAPVLEELTELKSGYQQGKKVGQPNRETAPL